MKLCGLFLVLMTVLETAHAQCENVNCQINQYCDPADSSCQDCSRACSGCSTGGANNCISCAIGFYNNSGICSECDPACKTCTGGLPVDCKQCSLGYIFVSGECKMCPAETYGENCTGSCHCMETTREECRITDGFCNGFQCYWGWSDPPYCQIACDNQFGANCQYDCHCPVNDTCDTKNGLCSSNQCADGYSGPGCQIELPRLLKPPTVTDNECGNATITWPAWVYMTDIGDKPVHSYILWYKGEDDWRNYSSQLHNASKKSYVEILTGLNDQVLYQFRVDTVLLKYNRPYPVVAPGLPTTEINVACYVATTTPVVPTPPRELPENIFASFDQTQQSDGSLLVSWELKEDNSDLIKDLYLNYTETSIGDDKNICKVLNKTAIISPSLIFSKNHTLKNLNPWRNYNVELWIKYIKAGVNASRPEQKFLFLTPEAAPTGVVPKLTATVVTNTTIFWDWDDLPCENRNGALVGYVLRIYKDGTFLTELNNITETKYLASNLIPFTNYSIEVSFKNKINETSPASYWSKTAEAAPSMPVNVTVTPFVTNVLVNYSPPEITNGIVREYSVLYSENADFSDSKQKNSNFRSTNITGLIPFNTYYFKVRARTGDNLWGKYSDAAIAITLEDKPSVPEDFHVASRNETCIIIEWRPPLKPNGNLLMYQVGYKKAGEQTMQKKNISVSSTSSPICDLQPGQQYLFEISASTSAGAGDKANMLNATIIGTPRIPPKPEFVNSTENTIAIEISPVVLDTGPVTFYYVYVELENSNRPYLAGNFSGITSKHVFVVGDSKSYGSVNNNVLEKGKKYRIALVIVSSQEGVTKTSSVQIGPYTAAVSSSTPSTGTVVGTGVTDTSNNGTTIAIIIIIIIIVIIIIVVIIVVIICWKRSRQYKYSYNPYTDEKDPHLLKHDDYDPHKNWNTIYSTRESRFIIVGRDLIPDGVPYPSEETLPTNPGTPPVTFHQEFHELPHGKLSSWNAAESNKAANLNRFPHLLPYDFSRVVLRPDENSSSDYINANYINGYRRPKMYIAAQSPFDQATVLDFWRMIYQCQVKLVVMISNIIEDKIVKCTQYWPDADQGVVTYGSFTLQLVDRKSYADFVIRTVKVQNGYNPENRYVHVFEFCTWPDHGVPADTIPLLDFRNRVRDYQGYDQSPMLVHCGTGVSRTGAFIAIDSLLDQYENDGRISVFSFVRKLRKQRVAMVRTPKQYVFIYEAIFEAMVAGPTRTRSDLKQYYHTLTMKNPLTQHSFLKDQFTCLQRFTRKPNALKCSTALLPVNYEKNRYPDVIPMDDFRPVLETMNTFEKTNYINAIFIDSFHHQNQFILTQTPLHTTVIDFWKLVFDYDVQTIVMMEAYKHDDDTSAQYWPENKAKKFEPFIIDNTEAYQKDNITVRHFKLTNMYDPHSTREVRQFQFNAWEEPDFVPRSKMMMMDLMRLVDEWQKECSGDTGHIIVHCKDGATNSGLYCAVKNICKSYDVDGVVDVFHSIKHMKRRRFQIIDTLDQYRFCYKLLWDFMNLEMDGGTLTDMMHHTLSDSQYVGSLSLPSYASHLDVST